MGANFDVPTGFYRQSTLPDPTNITREVYEGVRHLFYRHWDGLPVRKLSVTLSDFSRDNEYQLAFFGNRERTRSLERATDEIKNRFGTTSILLASSFLQAGQAKERSRKIGGHYK
jgi:DNA polymerase-4